MKSGRSSNAPRRSTRGNRATAGSLASPRVRRPLPQENLERMIRLAEEFFNVKSDPSQIAINRRTMNRLRKIHPSTLAEARTARGPIAWVAVIPTTSEVMQQFIRKEINEQDLLKKTIPGGTYDAIYLCSALVLPEHRGRHLAKRLVIKAIKSIQKSHPIKHLFYWEFSLAGKRLAAAIAKDFGLPLYKRKS